MIETPPRRFLTRSPQSAPAERLRSIAAAMPDGAEADHYGAGAVVGDLEREVADLLGKESAVFCTSGKTVQLSALRVHADRRGRTLIAAHPRSHVVEDENDAIGALYGLRVARVGTPFAPYTLDELAAVHEPLAAAVVELPLRRAGFRVPAWDDLVALAEHARDRGAAFHLDGARLWEAAPGYGKSLAQIAALADTAYVSFYKGLGGLAGAALAGDAATIAEARTWIGRAGGVLYRTYPYAASAHEGLRTELPRMAEYHARAVAIAAALRDVPGVAVSADPPSCNAFCVYLEGEHDALLAARDEVAGARGLAVFGAQLGRTPSPRTWFFELVIERGNVDLDVADIRDAIAAVVAAAR